MTAFESAAGGGGSTAGDLDPDRWPAVRSREEARALVALETLPHATALFADVVLTPAELAAMDAHVAETAERECREWAASTWRTS